ncbi:MAG: DUF3108 domain-containing protein [Candidatus Omnitrophica bacterium]|nr:DUF3108 domain-containing protein [Candidatus Omnitrophota bacterium]
MKALISTLLIFFAVTFNSFCAQEGIKARFEGKDTLTYSVYFNGFFSGKIKWVYVGTQKISGKQVDVLHLDSDTKIFSFLDMTSKEKIFLDSQTHLPIKVQRDIVLFGKDEKIEEFYNQDEGFVRITRSTAQEVPQEILRQDAPIHNILALLYFFPSDVDLDKKNKAVYNLPTRKVTITTRGTRKLRLGKEKVEAYFLVGKGAKRFNLWLDKKRKTPLRLEFLFPVGKVTIVKDLLNEQE